MITIKVEGISELVQSIDKQVKFAQERALNAAAYAAAQATSKELARVFDKPTSWVLRSVRYTKASRKTQQEMFATVDFDFWGNKQGVTVAHVLRAEIYGGQRKLKRHEIALQRVGILPAGHFIVPGNAAQLDAHGNMSPGQIVQIMSWFQSFGEQGYRANMRDGGRRLGRDNKKTGQRGFAYFVLHKPHGKLLPGVYQRFGFGGLGSSVKPVMIFVKFVNYRSRLDFYGIAERAARAAFKDKFPQFLEEARRTAR